jgi:ribosomal protein S27E/DNA-directed RNA polymerase subunit RPC12/RpoP
MKCADCGQDILQAHPEMCPYCKSKNLISEEDNSKEIQNAEQLAKAGRYEDAALKYEKLDMWDKAKSCRAVARKKHTGSSDLQEGKIETVTLTCPHCGNSQPISSKSTEEICTQCGTTYLIPEKIKDLL